MQTSVSQWFTRWFCASFAGLLLAPMLARGTAQVTDTLLWQGEEFALATLPLKPIMPDGYRGGQISSACWRGYRGSWEIADGKLRLTGLFACHGGQSLWSAMVPHLTPPAMAAWYSGVLRIPKGEMLEYVHMGFGSVYRQDVHLVIREGALLGTFEVTNDFNALTYRDRQGSELGKIRTTDDLEVPELIEGDWLDALTLRERMSAQDNDMTSTVTVRGLYFLGNLFLPGNGTAPALELATTQPETIGKLPAGSAVEAVLLPAEERKFAIQSLERLKEGAPIDRRGRTHVADWMVADE